MDKTDKVLKMFGKSEVATVVPIGSDVIIPNHSGITGNQDANAKLTLQKITDNGATTDKTIICTNATTSIQGTTSDQTVKLINGTASIIQYNSSNRVVIGPSSVYLTAGGTNIFSVTSSGGGVGNGANGSETSSKFSVASTSLGFLPPRMTTAQKNAIGSPAEGLMFMILTCINYVLGRQQLGRQSHQHRGIK